MIGKVTYRVFIEQIQRRLQNDFPSSEFTITDNEIHLYIFQALATAISAGASQQMAIEGINWTPDAYVTTFKIPTATCTRDYDSGTYNLSLPHPPIGLPLGYSIVSATLAGQGQRSYPLMPIHGFNKSYALKLPCPDGVFYEVEGDQLILTTSDIDLINTDLKLYITMLSPRGKNDDDPINAPDEVLAGVFDAVVARLSQRLATPKDMSIDGVSKKNEI